VIAATNSELPRMVADGTFRQDLFFRLNVIPITLPPLRERREDIPILVRHFLEKFKAPADTEVSQEAMRALMAFAWPGNVRQLENAVEHAVTLSAGRKRIEVADLPPGVTSVPAPATSTFMELPPAGIDLDKELARIELSYLDAALERTSGNKNRAAELLQIKRTTLVEKLKRLKGPAH
jgi:transcriptional regulator with PAS, ATPase and Fis domain